MTCNSPIKYPSTTHRPIKCFYSGSTDLQSRALCPGKERISFASSKSSLSVCLVHDLQSFDQSKLCILCGLVAQRHAGNPTFPCRWTPCRPTQCRRLPLVSFPSVTTPLHLGLRDLSNSRRHHSSSSIVSKDTRSTSTKQRSAREVYEVAQAPSLTSWKDNVRYSDGAAILPKPSC